MDKVKLLGMTVSDDYDEMEYTYRVGYPGQCPIALFLAMTSKHKNAVARYFNIFTYTENANKLQQEVQSSFTIPRELEDKFDDLTKFEPSTVPKIFNLKYMPASKPPKFNPDELNRMSQQFTEISAQPIVPLNVYASQFAQILSMLTAQYDSGKESKIMTCPMSYIKFWSRKEFTDVYNYLDIALNNLMDNVIYVFEERGIEFNKHSMTLSVPNYLGFKFVDYYGF